MTRQEIIAQLRAENPTSNLDGQTVSTGDPAYEALLERWADVQEARLSTQAEADAKTAFDAVLAAGYEVLPEGYRLRWDDSDRHLWNQQLILLREAEALGVVNGESPVSFVDLTGTVQTATLIRFRQIMVGLGMAFQQAFFARYGS